MSYYAKIFSVALGAILMTGLGNMAQASIVLDGTRVVYPAGKKEVTVTVSNQNNNPVLIQSWIDSGNPDDAASQNTPFILTPPINRIDAGKAQTLRISYLGSATMPTDRESVFYLNVLEVPAKAKDMDEKSKLNIAFRSRIKLFYRPNDLPGSAADAMETLHWKMKSGGVEVTNPSKFYVSLVNIIFTSGGKKMATKGKMIAPGATEFHEIQDSSITSINQLSYTTVNDYGGYNEFKAKP